MKYELERGDGSERCSICGLRQRDKSFYVRFMGTLYPVCSDEHARQFLEHAIISWGTAWSPEAQARRRSPS